VTTLIAPHEVSRLLCVSVSTVKRLTESGELPHIRVTDRRPRYRAEDVSAFVERRRKSRRQLAGNDDGPVSAEPIVEENADAARAQASS